jgi:hypothetical protein
MKNANFCTIITAVSLISIFAVANTSNEFVRVDQGWTDEDRKIIYQQDEGAQFVPLNWFLALEQAGSSELFVKSLNKYGFLNGREKNSDNLTNPYDLPVGMTISEDLRTEKLYGEKKWVGVNCAACHTTQVNVNNKRVVIDGGANMFNFNGFMKDVSRAFTSVIQDQQKWKKFEETVRSDNKEFLFERVSKLEKDLRMFLQRNQYMVTINGEKKSIDFGPERMDGIGLPNNEQICHLDELGDLELRKNYINPKNCSGLNPPTGIPHIWAAHNDEYTHFLGQIHSSFGRNTGQASGVLSRNWLEKGPNGEPVYKSTANLDGLLKIEKIYGKLRAPKWEDLVAQGAVSKLDLELVKKGQFLYKKARCAECHSTQEQYQITDPNSVGRQFWKVNVTPYKEVGTDPGRLEAEVFYKVQIPKIYKDKYIQRFGEADITDNEMGFSQKLRTLVVIDLITNYFDEIKLNPLDKAKASSCRLPDRVQPTLGYKAQNLAGIVWSAPYLHNSSVPTLLDLLSPPNTRPKTFYLGCREYDMNKVGYDCKENSENSFLVDTRIPGFSNQGHDYGTNLSLEEKMALIEYIKSIELPKDPTTGLICR